MPDLSLDKLNPSDGKMLILCGSDNAASGGIDDFVDAAKRFIDNGICVAAICGAGVAVVTDRLLADRTGLVVAHIANRTGVAVGVAGAAVGGVFTAG